MSPGIKHRLDYSDLQVVPDDGRRYELVRGALLVTPSPTPDHQRISKRLERRFEDYFEERGLGEVFHAPVDLILTDEDVFVPDVVVVTDPGHVSRRGIEAPPLLVVEILSPSTRERDRGVKATRYAELGIPHYWIVDPEARAVECFRFEGGAYRPVTRADGGAILTHPDWDGLAIDTGALWP